MSDKLKNIISNIVGILVILMALLFYIGEQIADKDFWILIGIGCIFFFFKVSETVVFIKKILTLLIKKYFK